MSHLIVSALHTINFLFSIFHLFLFSSFFCVLWLFSFSFFLSCGFSYYLMKFIQSDEDNSFCILKTFFCPFCNYYLNFHIHVVFRIENRNWSKSELDIFIKYNTKLMVSYERDWVGSRFVLALNPTQFALFFILELVSKLNLL